MKPYALLVLATAWVVSAGGIGFGGCNFKEWEILTNGKTYYDNGGMNDTFYQVGSIESWFIVGFFTPLSRGLMPPSSKWLGMFDLIEPCTRHELIQQEDYPIFKWAVQS